MTAGALFCGVAVDAVVKESLGIDALVDVGFIGRKWLRLITWVTTGSLAGNSTSIWLKAR